MASILSAILSFLMSFFFQYPFHYFEDHFHATPAILTSLNAPLTPPPPPPTITHYLLALQWPKSVCSLQKYSTKTCNQQPLPPSHAIHGLWPGSDNGKSELDCDPQGPFDSSKLNAIEPMLAKHWPQLFQIPGKTTKEGNYDFRLHRWKSTTLSYEGI